MSRLMNQEKAGYFPLPPAVTAMLLTYIDAPDAGRALDPCAGKGVALQTLATGLGLHPYGVELNQERAAAAQECLGAERILQDDYRNLVVPKESFNLLYNNPPYLFVEDKSLGRAEYQWLRDTRPHLQTGGLLVWVVPRHMLAHRSARRYLATWFDRLRVYRFPQPFYARFKQVVVFGIRKPKAAIPDPDRMEKLYALGKGEQSLPELCPQDRPLYTLPPLLKQPFHFRSIFVDPQRALAEAQTAGIATTEAYAGHLAPTGAAHRLDPLTPLKIGHMHSIIAAGHLNNQVIDDGRHRLLIKGHSYKRTVQATSEEDIGDGRTKLTRTTTEQVVTTITTVTPDGDIQVRSDADLEGFLAHWLPHLSAIVARQYPPRYQFDLNGYGPTLARLNQGRTIPLVGKPGLLPAQAHAAAAVATHLQSHKAAFVVGEMGTGKSLIGPAVAACHRARRTIVLCPPHLVKKWLREIAVTWPAAHAMRLKTISDVDAFFAHEGPVIGVMKETSARMASGWSHAFDWLGPASMTTRSRNAPWNFECHGALAPTDSETLHSVLSADAPLCRRLRVRCPGCGAVIPDGNGGAASPATFQNKQLKCPACRAPLHQDTRRRSKSQQPGSFARYVRREKAVRQAQSHGRRPSADHPSPNDLHGYARYPLATYILRHYAGRLDLLLADECHQFKGSSSDRGYAFQRLVSAARRVVGLTGTVYGGKASSLFYLIYRMVPEMKRHYAHNDVRRWVQHYGIMQEEETAVTDEDGKLTGNSRARPRIKELPGGSPAMLPWLLNRSVFISLQDMGFALPGYEEIPVSVAMTGAQKAMYDSLREQLMDELKHRLIRGDKSLLAGYLQALLAWPDSPWRKKVVRDPKTDEVVAEIPGLTSDALFPKEEMIITQIEAELARGRKVLLLCQQTGTLDITPQWQQMLRDRGITAAVLKVEPAHREEWVKKQLGRGVQVIITHPRRVETGLDLLEFPTIVWMGTEYSVYTVLQASRRSWRIGQTRPVKVFFYAYEDTLQEDALSLVAAKVAATLRINGDTVADDSLAELDELATTDIVTALARIATGAAERPPSLQDAFKAANDDFRAANAIIGDYKMVDALPEPQPDNPHVLVPASTDIPPLYATEKTDADDKLIPIKLFTPDSAWTWYLAEYDREKKLAFGYAINEADPVNAEWGYISIEELAGVRGHLGLKVERDRHWQPKPFGAIKARFGLETANAAAPDPQPEPEPEAAPATPAPPPADVEGYTVEDLRFLLEKVNETDRPLLITGNPDVLGLPIIQSWRPEDGHVDHLGFGCFKITRGDEFEALFDGGGALQQTPSGRGYCFVDVRRGEMPDWYDHEQVKTRLAQLITTLETPPAEAPSPEPAATPARPVFGQSPKPETKKRRRRRPAAATQMPLFSFA